jgi:hypothetical protein
VEKKVKSYRQCAKARKLLLTEYLNCKSWAVVAARFKLPNKANARLMCRGEIPVSDQMLAALKMRNKRFFMRQLRKIALPFLRARHVSPSGIYVRGGRPVEESWQ